MNSAIFPNLHRDGAAIEIDALPCGARLCYLGMIDDDGRRCPQTLRCTRDGRGRWVGIINHGDPDVRYTHLSGYPLDSLCGLKAGPTRIRPSPESSLTPPAADMRDCRSLGHPAPLVSPPPVERFLYSVEPAEVGPMPPGNGPWIGDPVALDQLSKPRNRPWHAVVRVDGGTERDLGKRSAAATGGTDEGWPGWGEDRAGGDPLVAVLATRPIDMAGMFGRIPSPPAAIIPVGSPGGRCRVGEVGPPPLVAIRDNSNLAPDAAALCRPPPPFMGPIALVAADPRRK